MMPSPTFDLCLVAKDQDTLIKQLFTVIKPETYSRKVIFFFLLWKIMKLGDLQLETLGLTFS